MYASPSNWIYDNADRGVQLFPDAQRTYVARNVIDGNGEGIVFSRRSANNVVEHNVISNSLVRYNVEDYELSGDGNVARRNCLWSPAFGGNAGISPGIEVEISENLVTEPAFAARAAKDFRLAPGSPCFSFSPGSAATWASLDLAPRLERRAGHPARQIGRESCGGLGLGLQHVIG